MILSVDDYLRWYDSPEWKDVILPWLENDQKSLYYELANTDANDTVAIAAIQGRLLELDRLMYEPERQLARLREEEQEKEKDDARRSGPVRRFIASRWPAARR